MKIYIKATGKAGSGKSVVLKNLKSALEQWGFKVGTKNLSVFELEASRPCKPK